MVDPTFQNSVQLNKTELTKLQLITKQKSNIQCAHAIQFDQGMFYNSDRTVRTQARLETDVTQPNPKIFLTEHREPIYISAQDMKRIIEVLWVWKRISLLIKGWKMNNTTFLYINKNGVIQSRNVVVIIEVQSYLRNRLCRSLVRTFLEPHEQL